ncbi:MAG: dUTP diphosphatase, partial [Enterobacterales bacterium]|nr:dUTP diphosphatase [Enterobacterales bacterium]
SKNDFRSALEDLALDTLQTKSFNVSLFASCLDLVNLSTEQLFKQYVGKNTLNFFRQDHGYQDGTYQKLWHGREDNEYLVDILDSTSSTIDDFPKVVYQKLKDSYSG